MTRTLCVALVLLFSPPLAACGDAHRSDGDAGVSADAATPTADADVVVDVSLDLAVDHFKGDPNAPDIVVEYGNLLCTHCRAFLFDHFPDLVPGIEDGSLLFVFRHFTGGAMGVATAAAAECVALQDEAKFFPFHDLVFENQADLPPEKLRQFVTDLGLDAEAYDTCVADGATVDRVTRDRESGESFGVRSTPTFFVNGRALVGARGIEAFQPLLDREP